MTTINVTLVGASPLLMHNNQCVDPLNPWKKKIAAITGKRKKTESDYQELYRLEFIAGLYIGDEGPFIPGRCFRRCLIEGAKKDKNGTRFQTAISVLNDAVLQYEGPRDAKAMWETGEFHLTTVVGNQRNSIMRTRPKFDTWECTFELYFDDSDINLEDIELALERSEQLGICDGRAIEYGSFKATIVAPVLA